MAFGGRTKTITLFIEYYERQFVAHSRSWANIFHLSLLAVIIILPFILTFQAGTFWAKQDIYQEQAQVKFTNQVYLNLMFTNPITQQSDSYVYSTSRNINNQVQNLLSPPTVQSSSQDFDRDGLNERFNISIRIRKPAAGLLLNQATVIAGFNYKTIGVVDMEMESLAIMQQNIPTYNSNPVTSLKAVGSLDFKQLYPLRRTRGVRSLYNDNLFSYLEYESLHTFLNRYTIGRNETTVYKHQVFTQRGLSSQNFIDINMVVNIPTYQDILYIPDVWEVLKFAWIQYYSFLLLIYVFLYHFFYGFIIKNKVYESIEITSINLKNLSKRFY